MSLSEIRVNTTKTRTGVGTITYTETGPVITGIATASNFKTGSTNVHSTGVELANINTGGSTATFGGPISGTTASFSGTVSIGGTLTYEDVTNIDSVGVITARSAVSIGDSIFHIGDTDTAIRFSDANQISAETAGDERLRIRSDGRVQVKSGSAEVIAGEGASAELRLTADEGDEGADYWKFQSNHSTNNLNIATYATGAYVDKFAIDTSGNIGQGSVTPTTPNGSNADNPNNGLVFTMYGDSPAINLVHNVAGGSAAADDYAAINFGRTGSSSNPYRAIIGYKQSDDILRINAKNSIAFDTGGDINSGERLRIASNGKIGIGIDPTARLHVNGLTSDTAIILARAADNNGIASLNLLAEGTTGSSRIVFSDTAAATGDAWISYSHNDRAFTFTTAGTGNERLRINQSGNVCVNTADTGSIFGQSTPISTYSPKLGVQGSIIIGNLSSTTSDRYELQFYRRGGASGGTSITSHDMGRIAWYGSSNDNDNSNMAWAIGVTPNGGTWNAGSNRVGYMSFVNHDGEQLRIDSSGRLQLGSISGNSQWGQDIVNIESGGDAGISIGRLEGGSPSNGQQLGSYSFQSAIGSQNAGSAEAKITAFAAENQSGTTAATDMSFWVKASGTGPGSAPTERMRLDSTGRLILNPANGDFTNPDIGGSTAGVTINKNTTGQIYACTDAGGSAASNDGTSTVLNLCRRNGAGDGPQLALDRGGWIKASLAGLSGSNTASGGKGQFAIYTHDYSSGANVRYQRIRIDSGGVQNYTGGSADNYYANVQIRHKTPYSTDGGYPGSQQTSTNQTVFSLYNESYGGNKMAFRSGQGHQFEIETKTRDLGSGSYNDADVYFRSQYDASLTDRYIIGSHGGHTFQSRSKVTFGVGSGGDIWFGENPYNSQWSATNAGGWYYREDQTSMIVASRANTGYSTFYINKNTGAGGSTDTRWIDFYWNSSQYGRIEYNGASGTNYVTSSDYRLKENIVSITDGITEVKKLKPYRFNFKTDDDSKVVQGFFAHEAQEIVPYAVSGTKDEVVTQAQVDAGSQPEEKSVGDPIYQNVDYGKFTPILTAALKEAIAKIEVLEAKVAALEGS